MKKTEKEKQDWENAKAWIAAYNDFNFLIVGATAMFGIVYFVLRMLGYDMSAFF